NPHACIVHAIAKRRHAPISGMPPLPAGGALSAAVTQDPGSPGPNSSAVLPRAIAVIARPLSVSRARRTGPGAFVGAIIQVGPASPRGARSATAVVGAATAAPTCAGSHNGIARTAASPDGKAGSAPESTSV